MPPKKPDAVTTAPVLSDISPFYLTEKSEWGLFKKAITSCGLIWNIPDWMSTIVYQGDDYLEIKKR